MDPLTTSSFEEYQFFPKEICQKICRAILPKGHEIEGLRHIAKIDLSSKKISQLTQPMWEFILNKKGRPEEVFLGLCHNKKFKNQFQSIFTNWTCRLIRYFVHPATVPSRGHIVGYTDQMQLVEKESQFILDQFPSFIPFYKFINDGETPWDRKAKNLGSFNFIISEGDDVGKRILNVFANAHNEQELNLNELYEIVMKKPEVLSYVTGMMVKCYFNDKSIETLCNLLQIGIASWHSGNCTYIEKSLDELSFKSHWLYGCLLELYKTEKILPVQLSLAKEFLLRIYMRHSFDTDLLKTVIDELTQADLSPQSLIPITEFIERHEPLFFLYGFKNFPQYELYAPLFSKIQQNDSQYLFKIKFKLALEEYEEADELYSIFKLYNQPDTDVKEVHARILVGVKDFESAYKNYEDLIQSTKFKGRKEYRQLTTERQHLRLRSLLGAAEVSMKLDNEVQVRYFCELFKDCQPMSRVRARPTKEQSDILQRFIYFPERRFLL